MAKLSSLNTPPELVAVIPTPAAAPDADDSLLLLDAVQDPATWGHSAHRRRRWRAPGVVVAAVRRSVVGQGAARRHGRTLPWRCTDAELTRVLAEFNGPAIVTSLDAAQSLYALDLRQPCAFVFITKAPACRHSAGRASHPVRIPMPGVAESLNVAAAVAVCLFEQVRQRLPD